MAPNGSVYESQTRDEALADALGVRRTPRRPVDGAPTRGGRGLEPRNRAEATTPANLSMYPQGPSRFVKDASYVDADASLIDTPHLLNLQPLSNLHPVVALECMYEEGGESSPANNVFLASNLEGSGLLVLCLVVPSVEGSTNPNVMKLFSLEPSLDEPLAAQEIDDENMYGTLSESLRHNFSIRPISTKSCLAAQPIQATPTPLRHLPYGNNRNNEAEMATDVLVLWKSDNEQTRISLHRSQTYILDCALCDGNSEGKHAVSYVTDIQNAVRGHVDFVRGNDVENCVSLRGNISLEIQSDALTEKILVAIEDFMFTKSEELSKLDFLEFALHLRGDCCRLEQKLNSDAAGFVARVGNKAWAAFETLFCHILDSELFGSNEKSHPRSVTENMDSTWARLLDSSFHASYFEDNFDSLFLGGTDSGLLSDKSEKSHTKQDNLRRLMSSIGCHTSSTSVPGVSIIAGLFDTLHLVYEELKLSYDSNIADHLRSVSSPLIRTCFTVISAASNRNVESGEVSIMNNFLAHYSRGIGSRWVESIQADMNRRKKPVCMDLTKTHVTSFNEPPCLMTWLDATLRNSDRRGFYDVDDISTINAGCRMTRSVLRIFSLLFCSEKQSQSERDYAVVSALCEEGFATAQEVRAKLPVGICVPILEALNRCRDDPELESFSGWTSAEFTLIGRPDLSMNNEKDSHKGAIRSTASEIVPVRVSDRDNPTFADKDKDGLVPLEVSSAMLFPEDNRIREAGRLLRSSRPCFLSVSRSVEVSDHDYERLKQNKLLLLCRRSLALPVGRGMVTIGTFQPVAAEPLPVPDLCLSGRIPPANTNLALDLSECQSDFKIWPEFHNGVAAGLRLPLGGDIEESITKITRTWIVYNRPTTAPENQPQNQGNQTPPPPKINSHAHGGLLLALGLRGHLSELEMTDLFDYLTQGQVTLTCGVLLGMAANKRGTCDISVSKMLCLHLPSLIPQHFSAIDVASPVQTAAVAGAGLLFQGSSHRMMTEFLLNEIGRRPESDVALDREAYTLSCGIALGMVNLCKGERIHDGQGSGLSDLRIGERLYRYIVGGTDEEEARRMREANDRLNLPPNSSTGDNERCSCVFEGNSINIDVTAAGATLALGLIFMKTG